MHQMILYLIIFKKQKNHFIIILVILHGKSSQFPGGSAASVGISGISGVGGIGNLRRKFGMTIDSILSIKITIPPNSQHKAKTIIITKDDMSESNSNKYSDLFWAICGGGANNFGIISEIQYQLYWISDLIQYEVIFDTKQELQIISQWALKALNLPDEFTEEMVLATSIDNKSLSLSGFYVMKKNQSKKKQKK